MNEHGPHRHEAELLDRYWSALARNPAAPPPEGLDPELAALARRLERELRPPAPDAVFAATLRRRLLGSTAGVGMGPNGRAPGPAPGAPPGPAGARRPGRPRRHRPSAGDRRAGRGAGFWPALARGANALATGAMLLVLGLALALALRGLPGRGPVAIPAPLAHLSAVVAVTPTAPANDPAAGVGPATVPAQTTMASPAAAPAGTAAIAVPPATAPAGSVFGPAAAPGAGPWLPAGALAVARYGHTATALPDGRVLIAGGVGAGGDGALAATERYDPATGRWTRAADLNVARVNHSPTLLRGGYAGQVLVTGGFSRQGGQALAAAERYDPAADRWVAVAPLTVPRVGHSATLLPDGTVLVAGGYTTGRPGGATLDTAERYDPATDRWSPAGALATARAGHTTTPLPDGRVLVAGGANGSGALASAEVYDLATDRWTGAGAMATARTFHAATLLPDGQVLVTGQDTPAGGGKPDLRAERYDPATNRWGAAGTMNAPHRQHTATLLPGGLVLVAGGGGADGSSAAVELYDPATSRWTFAASLAAPRFDHTATPLPGGRVLVVGGGGAGGPVGTAELYTDRGAPPPAPTPTSTLPPGAPGAIDTHPARRPENASPAAVPPGRFGRRIPAAAGRQPLSMAVARSASGRGDRL